jgi:hypothetical protein
MYGTSFWVIQLDRVLLKHVSQQLNIYSKILNSLLINYIYSLNRNNVLQGRPITPEAIEELADKLYESLLQEASVNFVSFIYSKFHY